MFLDQLMAFFQSPHWLRLLLGGILLAGFIQVRSKYPVPFAQGLMFIPIILMVRDFIAFFVENPIIYVLSDAATMILYAYWIRGYNPKITKALIFAIALGGSSVALSVMQIILPSQSIIYTIALMVITGAAAWLTIMLFNISTYNTENAEFITKARIIFITALLVTRGVMILEFNLLSPLAQWVLYPLSLIPHFYLGLKYLDFFRSKFEEREKYNTAYIASLFDFMRTIGSAMVERIEVKNVINYIIASITKYVNADGGVVMLRDAAENVLRLGAMHGFYPPPIPVPAVVKTKLTGVQKFFESHEFKMGETILGESAAKNLAIFIRKTVEDPRMIANTKDDTLFISSLIVVPLIVNKEIFGVASIIRRKKDNLFTEEDYERARVFIEYASLTLDSLHNYAQLLEKQEIEREVNIAATIQKKLLPNRIPKMISNLVHAFTRPAKGVSGDYYDIIPLNPTGKFAMVICDVAGKGVPASLIMVMIRTIIHTIGGAKKNAAEVVSWINRGIAGRIDIERFATLSYLTYDPLTSTVEYSNAGHHPLLLYRAASQEIEKIDSPGLPIGLERDSKYQLVNFQMNPGDIVFTYTDGIIEAMNYLNEQFEEERLVEVFKSLVDNTPKEIVNSLREAVDGFVGDAKQHDDMTMIVLKAQ